MTTFYCLRHARTDWNVQSRIQGQTDTALSEEGCGMARNWAQSLPEGTFDMILTSPLGRAVETAQILNAHLGLPLHTDPGLVEQDWGQWTGLTKAELKELRSAVKAQEKRGFAFTPPGGESRDSVLMRACDALIGFAAAHPRASVLVVTHHGVLKCLAYALSGLDYLPGDPRPIKPYRLHRIECLDNELAPAQLNLEFDALAAAVRDLAALDIPEPDPLNPDKGELERQER
ncbi:MAG: histidine phosphatase family protein [Pseudodesulfovibrio sp.]|uniref:Phosphoglycerate mutase n=1 Tax=Pseudodesulfovibrio aespoeensis (strain ATCC 700646 / DSM 10631 / Aspo-2) TaxID=643562 RepID=E6VSF9_PSEA9|nr:MULTISPECIES: histidine phosphatase family protein [Pseudodesulfovibrio]MBU4192467.1 histidine phosphatase family protein [Pseudomonadota bacterium]ADU64302.1 Phosphoglycerate mutase [Pseudodesulfovibrio aespoeensis Aspo-2]MBU4245260.1 histidine phosphatase family protein [Pseudomonadota bacterium]MBU4380103.1 histidine phosphatase family protein [Pseudomonadota bacterium]MBU4476723.1 histidine phosphatase family protein [Pseudomonadota bacterium]